MFRCRLARRFNYKACGLSRISSLPAKSKNAAKRVFISILSTQYYSHYSFRRISVGFETIAFNACEQMISTVKNATPKEQAPYNHHGMLTW